MAWKPLGPSPAAVTEMPLRKTQYAVLFGRSGNNGPNVPNQKVQRREKTINNFPLSDMIDSNMPESANSLQSVKSIRGGFSKSGVPGCHDNLSVPGMDEALSPHLCGSDYRRQRAAAGTKVDL